MKIKNVGKVVAVLCLHSSVVLAQSPAPESSVVLQYEQYGRVDLTPTEVAWSEALKLNAPASVLEVDQNSGVVRSITEADVVDGRPVSRWKEFLYPVYVEAVGEGRVSLRGQKDQFFANAAVGGNLRFGDAMIGYQRGTNNSHLFNLGVSVREDEKEVVKEDNRYAFFGYRESHHSRIDEQPYKSRVWGIGFSVQGQHLYITMKGGIASTEMLGGVKMKSIRPEWSVGYRFGKVILKK